jgi:eukaryotic-like serine/threonine-protein kinase
LWNVAQGDVLPEGSSEPIEEFPLPEKLFGYEVLKRIGGGAASWVYAVSDARTSQVYALKHVVRKTEKDDRFIAQLENEYEVSKKFVSSVLRRSVELKMNRTLFRKVNDAALVMEWVDGVPLSVQRPDDAAIVARCFWEVARGLQELHNEHIIHCDLKPGNILLNSEEKGVKLIDFGQACPAGTKKERIQGTPDYIAPEQMRLKPVDERTDIYNFGASFYWTLTGRKVPTVYTVEKGHKHIVTEQDYPSPRQINPQVSEVVSKLVMQCLKYDPFGRPGEMGFVIEVLCGAVNGK